ncbi:MAG: SDR family oxidoreductase [Edaphobacter sp.]|uniref:SDR family oxidoreductase n=1 Tax=Edaphobacter sp. TaxID=1934404 RepID=UPI0023908965|nr:SDR family oxidoreductase [Edaphobacter sp.]MDE1176689.1 SDR family oxidoreductase [Edaphobacter sp.]
MIVVTGATGQLGRLVVEQLLKAVPAKEIVAAVRTPSKAADLAAKGVTVREGDYAKPETLLTAFAGAEKVLLVSSNELFSDRVVQHKAAVDAAKAAGVKLLVYTSVLRADTSGLGLAAAHRATEEYIKASGLPYVFLRNGWYMENHTEALGPALEHGAILGASKDGRIAGAMRRDYAAAAVKVLTEASAVKPVYELAGDAPYTVADIAAEVSRQSGKPVVYNDMPVAEYEKALQQFGLPVPLAKLLADSDAGVARGELDDSGHELSRLLGRPTESLATAVQEALKG